MLLALAACSSPQDGRTTADPGPTAAPTASARASTLVALGDSFTAGPGIGRAQDGAGFCQRSASNWPSLLAATADLELRDVSCVGATTADLASTVASGVLDAGPRVVTVAAGGNDSGLFSSLISSCAGGGNTCRSFVEEDVPRILKQTTSDVVSLLTTVRRAAPDAEVVLVGYPRIVPESGTCAALGVSASGVELLESAESALDQGLAAAAERAGEKYVAVREASRGHDACAGPEAWTNGRTAADGDGIFFHPTTRGMKAVAELVADEVSNDAV